MARTLIATLPNVTVTNGSPRTSPSAFVPLGVSSAQVDLDGSAWPGGTQIEVSYDLSNDGGTIWNRTGTIGASSSSLIGGHCMVGAELQAPNANASLKIRAKISVLVGTSITLAGTITVL